MNTPTKSLLVVDDDPGYRRMLTEALREQVDELLTASSGEETLEVLAMRSVGLVLLDLRLPGPVWVGWDSSRSSAGVNAPRRFSCSRPSRRSMTRCAR